MGSDKLKKILIDVWNFIFDVYIMFLVFGTSGIIFAFSYLVPKYGIELFFTAVAFVSFTRINGRLRRKKEE